MRSQTTGWHTMTRTSLSEETNRAVARHIWPTRFYGTRLAIEVQSFPVCYSDYLKMLSQMCKAILHPRANE